MSAPFNRRPASSGKPVHLPKQNFVTETGTGFVTCPRCSQQRERGQRCPRCERVDP